MERKWWQLPEGWLPLPLLLLMLLTVTRSIFEGSWERELQAALGFLPFAALGGLLLGFLLAWARRIPAWLAHGLGVVAGAAWIVQLSGTLRSVQITAFSEPIAFIHPSLTGWRDLAADLLLRTIFLGRTFRRGDSGADVVLFIVVLAFVAWFLGFLSAWFTYRSHWPWMAVGLPAAVLLLNLVYGPQVPPRYFNYYAFLALVFLVYYLWRQRELGWEKEAVRFPQQLSQGVLWAGVILAVVLVAGAAFLPTSASSEEAAGFWGQFLDPWHEVRGSWERLFGSVGVSGETRLGAYSPSFELSGPRHSIAGIALEVDSERIDYLRGITFDLYDGRGWTNTAARGIIWQLSTDQRLGLTDLGRVRVVQAITPRMQGGNMIFAMAEPISSSLPLMVELGTPRGEAGYADTISLRYRSSLEEGRTFYVASLLSVADKVSLRAAGMEYPNWVVERYTGFPDSLPERVRTLADQILAEELLRSNSWSSQPVPSEGVTLSIGEGEEAIGVQLRRVATEDGGLPETADEEGIIVWIAEDGQVAGVSPSGALVQANLITAYDAAETIQNYLRDEYPYDEAIDAPPADVDVVDHFLFVGRAGYCDYFASAMTVLLRTQGIAARLARGYASGVLDEELGLYIVPLSSAHSWTEVYFPGYGWQRFEPTAAGYTILPTRPEESPQSTGPRRPPRTDEDRELDEELILEEDMPRSSFMGPGFEAPSSFPWAAVVVPGGILMLGLAFAAAGSLWLQRGLRQLSPAAATYERMCRWATVAGLAPQRQSTPYEFAGRLERVFADQGLGIRQIVTSYVRERFGGRRVEAGDMAEMRRAWKDLRWRLWGRLISLRRHRQRRKAEEAAE